MLLAVQALPLLYTDVPTGTYLAILYLDSLASIHLVKETPEPTRTFKQGGFNDFAPSIVGFRQDEIGIDAQAAALFLLGWRRGSLGGCGPLETQRCCCGRCCCCCRCRRRIMLWLKSFDARPFEQGIRRNRVLRTSSTSRHDRRGSQCIRLGRGCRSCGCCRSCNQGTLVEGTRLHQGSTAIQWSTTTTTSGTVGRQQRRRPHGDIRWSRPGIGLTRQKCTHVLIVHRLDPNRGILGKLMLTTTISTVSDKMNPIGNQVSQFLHGG